MLCSGFRFLFQCTFIYLRLLTVLPAILILQPLYQTVSDDFFLYYISFVYLKSIKDLSSFRLPFYRKADAKVNAFFYSAKLFGSFFEKVFFRKTEGRLSRSLGQYQGKILAQPEAGSATEFFSMSFQLPEPSLPKAVAKV